MTRRNRRNATLRIRALPANLARRAAAPMPAARALPPACPPEPETMPGLTFHVSRLDLAAGEILAGRRQRDDGS
jgi:hypothetical protein